MLTSSLKSVLRVQSFLTASKGRLASSYCPLKVLIHGPRLSTFLRGRAQFHLPRPQVQVQPAPHLHSTRSGTMAAQRWNYDNQAEWAHLPGSAASGSSQSPIHIQTEGVTKSEELKPLKLTGWETPVSGSFENTGRSVQFTPNSDAGPVTVEFHRGLYAFKQFHFHWGECHGQGSEHLVDGQQYDLEIHFVHKKLSETRHPAAACDGLAVLAVFGMEDSSADGITGAWRQLTAPQQCSESLPLDGVTFSELLPSNLDYYHYQGSLTTPPCSEVVQWLVLKEPVKVPREFIERLRSIEDEEKGRVCPNYRDVQPTNQRKIATPT